MADVLDALKVLGPAFLDPWFVVDAQERIVAFSPAFQAMFPKSVGRQLSGMSCRDVSVLPRCHGDGGCLRQQCHAQGPLRLDEVDAVVASKHARLALTAVPLTLGDGSQGALIVLRDLSAEAQLHSDYRALVDTAKQERRGLEETVESRTRELLAANQTVNALEREVARLRRGGS